MKISLSTKWFNILVSASLLTMLLMGVQSVATAHAAATTYLVGYSGDTSFCDVNGCTLRGAINAANANVGADTINFLNGTVTLTSDLPTITEELTINAQTATVIIDGVSLYRPFIVNSGVALTIKNLTIQNGFADTVTGPWGASGGAISNAGTLNVYNSTFKNNSSAVYGGAILNQGTLARIINSTFSGNLSPNYGGGIQNVNGATLVVQNSTFSGNSAPNGAGIWNEASLFLINTIIANSTGPDCQSIGTIGADFNNLIESTGTSACGLVDATNGDHIGVDPSLGTLANNGGPTNTFALLTGSPAINKADNGFCSGALVNSIDQTSKTRLPNGGATCDIGAYEVWDTNAPASQIDSGPASFTTSTSASIAFSATDDFSASNNLSFTCYSPDLDPANWVSCSSPVEFTGLSEGLHYLYAYATDEVGNSKSLDAAYIDWTVDLTAPTATINVKPTNPTMKALATFNFSATDNVTSAPNFLFDCKLDSGSFAPCNSGAKSYTVLNGSHTFKVRATDQAGNLSSEVSYAWVAGAKNAGLNTYTGTSKVPTSWTATNFKTGDGKDLINFKQSPASVVMLGATGLTKSLQQTITVSGVALEKFTFSFWVKGSLIPATGICRAQVMFYKNLTLVQTKFIDCPIGTYGFLSKSVVFNTSAVYNKITIQFINSKATGKVWFDLVNLKK